MHPFRLVLSILRFIEVYPLGTGMKLVQKGPGGCRSTETDVCRRRAVILAANP